MATREGIEGLKTSAQEFWSTFVRPRIAHILGVSAFDSNEVVLHARQTIDEELSAMHLAMCALRTQRNSLFPVSCLPPEILTRIFELYASDHHVYSLDWMRITHVCRRWRQIAIQYPKLWTNINFSFGLEWASTMLARSKAAPVDFREYSLDYGEGLVSQHFFHLRHLTLSGYARDLKRVVWSLRPPANALESLTMSSQGELSLTADALSGSFPRLGRVILVNVVAPWSSPIFCSGNLTHLRIEFLRGMQIESGAQRGPALDGPSEHEQFIDALQKMPRLEQLLLENCLPIPPRPVAGAPARTVELACLKKLSLTDGVLECTGVVRWIKVPPSCTVSLSCSTGAAHIMDVVSFLIAHANAESDCPPFYKLTAETNIDVVGSVSIQIWRRPDTLPIYPRTAFDVGGTPDLEIRFPRDMQTLHPLESLCRALPLDGLGVLVHSKVFPWPAWSPQEWIDLFGRCDSLTHISISGNDATPLSEALAISMIAHETSSVGPGMTAPVLEPLFFKNLETLRLEHCGNPVGFGVVMPVMGGDGLFYDKLLEWLNMRKESRPFPVIVIRRCSITKEQIEELKKVAWVNWDGESGEEIQEDDFDEIETEIADDDEEALTML